MLYNIYEGKMQIGFSVGFGSALAILSACGLAMHEAATLTHQAGAPGDPLSGHGLAVQHAE